MFFPLFLFRRSPKANWAGSNLGFGAIRYMPKNVTVMHGACDLIAKAGTKVLAVEEGTVIRGPYFFVHYAYEEKTEKGKITQHACSSTTYAIDVQHPHFIARYGEIAEELPAGVAPGKDVKKGQHIASVGLQCGDGGVLGAGSMLHFELFQNANDLSVLTVNPDPKYLYVQQASYLRRKDLLDPTLYLNAWAAARKIPGAEVGVDAIDSVAKSLGSVAKTLGF